MKQILIFVSFLFLMSCNFHTVEEGVLYRSAQPTAKAIERAYDEYGIKTIINLRGENDDDWYLEEEQIARELGIKLINIKMRASRIPLPKDLEKLFEAFDNAPKPILMHCQAGADRTGEASAIYAMEYMGKSKEEALKMLTPKFFHIEKRHPAKRYFIKKYEGRDWAINDYNPCDEGWEHFPREEFCEE